MPLYEVELRGSRIEERLTDHPLEVGQSIQLGGGGWIVAQSEVARDSARALRYICVRTREEAEALRAAASVRVKRASQISSGERGVT